METKPVTLELTESISQAMMSLLSATVLIVRRQSMSEIVMLQQHAVSILSALPREEVTVFMNFMTGLHTPFCTATGEEMDPGHAEFAPAAEGEIGTTEIIFVEDGSYPGQYL